MKTGFLFFILLLLSLGSCVGKKKFLTEVSGRAMCDSTLLAINSHNLELNKEIAHLQLKLAEKSGEGNALREIYDKQVFRIEELEDEIEQLSNQSQTQLQTLDGTIQQNEKRIAEKEEIINGFKTAIEDQRRSLAILLGRVRDACSEYTGDQLYVEVKNGFGYIRVSEKLLFRKGTTRLNDKAFNVLEKISSILTEYPEMDFLIVGHTDNQPIRNRNIKDNWDLSVLRAAPVARMLTKEFGMNPNQIQVVGKGEYKPLDSNDTVEGREKNRRMEIIVYPPSEKILKMIQESK